MSGCGNTRVVFVGSEKSNELFRVGKNVKGKAYFWNGKDWTLSKNEITYPEGAFVGFLNEGSEEEEK